MLNLVVCNSYYHNSARPITSIESQGSAPVLLVEGYHPISKTTCVLRTNTLSLEEVAASDSKAELAEIDKASDRQT